MNAKSERKPLRNVTNNDVRRSSKSVNLKKMISQKHKEQTSKEEEEDGALDRLLLVQSDIASVLHQIDELVVQAFKLKTASKEGRKEIKSFSLVLSDMLSSLKPWAARFQRAQSTSSEGSESQRQQASVKTSVVYDDRDESNVSDIPEESESQPQQALVKKSVVYNDRDESNVSDSPEETKLNSLVSPSPLVSWRANCTIERGRQMFMLTPLPISKALSSKRQEHSKSEFNKLTSSTNAIGTSALFALSRDIPGYVFDAVVMKPTPMKPSASAAAAIEGTNAQGHECTSPPHFPKRDSSMLVMTPCLKMSPPKSCVLLEPISEICHLGNDKVRKCTPFPVGIHYSDSETSGSGASQGLALKYPELLGIHQTSKTGVPKKWIEASPDWFISPPKSCVLLEPPDEKSLDLEKADNNACIQKTDAALNEQTSKFKDDVIKDHNQTRKSCKQEYFGGSLSHIESTPMWREPESSFPTGKRPGETTLKKELWTKFEAASTTHELLLNCPTVCNTAQKGFLDLLEEASCDD
ncbi:UDP-N-acetylglucosamine pyrophosphorylase [Senna tora]|uniref:UDP-N-acetylglucosamine pyrophosphorylase n=1 Tax=Senna tora TaxID=362788 RepID=A0A835CHK3_9FABA|nr:UDP-N-acetylglucosamine pyrophosphorylase [Senna tora]